MINYPDLSAYRYGFWLSRWGCCGLGVIVAFTQQGVYQYEYDDG